MKKSALSTSCETTSILPSLLFCTVFNATPASTRPLPPFPCQRCQGGTLRPPRGLILELVEKSGVLFQVINKGQPFLISLKKFLSKKNFTKQSHLSSLYCGDSTTRFLVDPTKCSSSRWSLTGFSSNDLTSGYFPIWFFLSSLLQSSGGLVLA